MSTSDAYTLYINRVSSSPAPDPTEQLRHARRMDRHLLRVSRSLTLSPSVLSIIAQDIESCTTGGHVKRVISRVCVPADLAGNERESDEKQVIAQCTTRLLSLIRENGNPSPNEVRAHLSWIRFSRDYLYSLVERLSVGATGDAVVTGMMRRIGSFIRHALSRIDDEIDHLVQANQRLVVTTARQYQYGPIPFMDLVQEGNLGILRAAERFDPYRDTRFSTYASWWIRRAMVYAIARQGHVVQPSVSRFWETKKLVRDLDKLEMVLGRKPSQSEASVELQRTTLELAGVRETLAQAISLDGPVSAESDIPLIDRVPADEGDIHDVMAHGDAVRIVASLLDQLPKRHAGILRMRFGIGVHESCTLEQIAQQQGVTRERIRQLEAQALGMIRNNITLEMIADYLMD